MRAFTASDAKNKFGELLDTVSSEPVTIQRNGRDVAVVISAAEFSRLSAGSNGGVSDRVKALHARSKRRFDKVYRELAK